MKKLTKILVALSMGVMMAMTAFAMDADTAQDIVSNMYPGVMIYGVEDNGDGSYNVLFHSQNIAPSSVTVDSNGNVINRNVNYR